MPLIILALFIGLEAWGISRMIHAMGGSLVLLWLLGVAILGSWMIAHGGLTALSRMRHAMARGELPSADIFQMLITAVAGLLLIVPGFVTDLLAVSLLISGGRVKRRLAEQISSTVAQARPDLKKPITLDGEFRRKP